MVEVSEIQNPFLFWLKNLIIEHDWRCSYIFKGFEPYFSATPTEKANGEVNTINFSFVYFSLKISFQRKVKYLCGSRRGLFFSFLLFSFFPFFLDDEESNVKENVEENSATMNFSSPLESTYFTSLKSSVHRDKFRSCFSSLLSPFRVALSAS